MLNGMLNSEDPDQTAPLLQEQSDLDSFYFSEKIRFDILYCLPSI